MHAHTHDRHTWACALWTLNSRQSSGLAWSKMSLNYTSLLIYYGQKKIWAEKGASLLHDRLVCPIGSAVLPMIHLNRLAFEFKAIVWLAEPTRTQAQVIFIYIMRGNCAMITQIVALKCVYVPISSEYTARNTNDDPYKHYQGLAFCRLLFLLTVTTLQYVCVRTSAKSLALAEGRNGVCVCLSGVVCNVRAA